MRQESMLEISAEHSQLIKISDAIADLLGRADNISDREEITYGVQLAVHEICANIVDHAYGDKGGNIKLKFSIRPNRFEAEIHDRGKRFNPSEVTNPDLENGQVRGYGLFIVRELMDEVQYGSRFGVNRWKLTKSWAS